MTETTKDTPAEAVREYRAQCNGSQEIHAHWTNHLRYTDGIKFVADTLGAHWLIDVVASHQRSIHDKHRGAWDFQVWRLVGAMLTQGRREPVAGWLIEAWSDTPGDEGSTLLARQEIPYTDFPDELMPFEFWVESATMLLKEEH